MIRKIVPTVTTVIKCRQFSRVASSTLGCCPTQWIARPVPVKCGVRHISVEGQGKIEKPSYELTFTCKKCSTRSSHVVSKQAYHHGTVLIQCPGCKNRHLMADHLKIFSDKAITIEDIMKLQGQTVTKRTVDSSTFDIDIEPPETETETETGLPEPKS